MFIFPINKEPEPRSVPWAVLTVVFLNGLVLAITYMAFSPEIVFRTFGFLPAQPYVSSLLTSMFLHVGLWHLLGNVWFLWMFGNQVENIFRPSLFMLTYLVCGLGGFGLHYIFNHTSTVPCVGASGAISGIAGCYFVLFPKAKFEIAIYYGWSTLKTIDTSARGAIGAWILEQTLLGIFTQASHTSAVAFWAHVGGFATGALAGLLFVIVVPEKMRRRLA
jgi:membrane associated rhomboid family serine protease